MTRTIVQEYGPIYGEAVNGTVQGRPNGSVYVPMSNVINLSILADHYVRYIDTGVLATCDSSGVIDTDGYIMSAIAQDLASNMQLQIYSDEEMTSLVAINYFGAGDFNYSGYGIFNAVDGLTDGQKLYVRAQLLNNTTPIATSDAIEVVMVVTE